MMKICPFCKNTTTENNDTCPHCRRILVERIETSYQQQSQNLHQETKTSTNKHPKIDFDRLTKNFKSGNFKKYVPILALLLLIIFIIIQKEKNSTHITYNSDPISVIPNNENLSVELGDTPVVHTKDTKAYISLPNGTVLSKNSYYLKGLGQLKIDNGTKLDAIAKLVNISTNKSIFTVYIKADSAYNISKISNGNYKLFFNLGNDWVTGTKAFAINSSYKVFEENFDFTTREYEEGDYVRTQYATFSVTLNPVIGGQAETENISAVEFANY